MTLPRITVAVCALGAFCGSALADPAQTVLDATMRAAPSARARVVQRVPANAAIDLSSCTERWCYVSWRNLFGYLPVEAIEASPYPPPRAYGGAVVVGTPNVWGPGYYYGGGWGWRGRRW